MTKSYKDIRKILQATKVENLVGKGVSDAEIKKAEGKLGVSLPLSYKFFLKEYGWGYFGSLENICGLGSDIPDEWEAGVNLLRVVSDERNGPLGLPKSMIPFYHNGAGDWYAFDCSVQINDESPVVFLPHEKIANQGFLFESVSDNFADWIFSKLFDDSVG